MAMHSNCYSADVTMWLQVNGDTLAVRQLGPDWLMLDTPYSSPPAAAQLILRIDHDQSERTIFLPAGITPHIPHTAIGAA